MTNVITSNTSNNKRNAMRVFFVMCFFAIGTGGVFGQESVATEAEHIEARATVSESRSKGIEMIKWILGGSAVFSPSETSTETLSGKKALINAGMKPNRILNNSLLKKAISYDCLAA